MATYRDRDAQAVVEAVQMAQNMLAQNMPEMVAARPSDVVIPPVPRSVVGAGGTIETLPPQDGPIRISLGKSPII